MCLVFDAWTLTLWMSIVLSCRHDSCRTNKARLSVSLLVTMIPVGIVVTNTATDSQSVNTLCFTRFVLDQGITATFV